MHDKTAFGGICHEKQGVKTKKLAAPETGCGQLYGTAWKLSLYQDVLDRTQQSAAQASAMASTSQSTPLGRSFTATQLRAGLEVKYLA